MIVQAASTSADTAATTGASARSSGARRGTSASSSTDAREAAKSRMRAASAPRPKAEPRDSSDDGHAWSLEKLKDFDHTTVVDFVKRHPLATAAGVGAAASIIGPFRLVRVGMAAFRTVSLAAGVVTFLGTLGVPAAEQAVEDVLPNSNINRARRQQRAASKARKGSPTPREAEAADDAPSKARRPKAKKAGTRKSTAKPRTTKAKAPGAGVGASSSSESA